MTADADHLEDEMVTFAYDSSAVHTRSHRSVMQRALPLLTSLALHAGLLGLGFLTYRSVSSIIHVRMLPQTTIPQSPMLLDQMPADAADPMNGTRERRKIDEVARDASDSADASAFGSGIHRLVELTGDKPSSDDVFIGAGSGGLSSTLGLHGDGTGGTGLQPFGGGSFSGGKPNIFGPAAVHSAKSVAFLCDASGSMLAKFSALKVELSKAITAVRPNQSFNVIFFGDDRSICFGPSLVMGTPENHLKATDFLENVTPRGTTDPLPALELAFKQKPELIFLLTDGDFPDNDAVLKLIRRLNTKRGVRINTIAFVGEGDTDIAFISLLKQIAAENGGMYKHVTQDQLR